jgi:hypothetical protein
MERSLPPGLPRLASSRRVSARIAAKRGVHGTPQNQKLPNKPWGVCEGYLACSSMQEPDASPLSRWAWEGGICNGVLICYFVLVFEGADVIRMASMCTPVIGP